MQRSSKRSWFALASPWRFSREAGFLIFVCGVPCLFDIKKKVNSCWTGEGWLKSNSEMNIKIQSTANWKALTFFLKKWSEGGWGKNIDQNMLAQVTKELSSWMLIEFFEGLAPVPLLESQLERKTPNSWEFFKIKKKKSKIWKPTRSWCWSYKKK